MSYNKDDWTIKHIVTTFIVGLLLLLALAAIIGGIVYDRDKNRTRDNERRAAVEQCLLDETRSAIDCRVAVYGSNTYY